MRLTLRSMIGLAAGFATMGLVLASALTAPTSQGSIAASKCPYKVEQGEGTAAAAAGAATPHAPVAVEAAP